VGVFVGTCAHFGRLQEPRDAIFDTKKTVLYYQKGRLPGHQRSTRRQPRGL